MTAMQLEQVRKHGQQVAALVSHVTGVTLRLYQTGHVLKPYQGGRFVSVYSPTDGETFKDIIAAVAPRPEWWIKLFVNEEALSREVSRYCQQKWRKRAGDKGVVILSKRAHN